MQLKVFRDNSLIHGITDASLGSITKRRRITVKSTQKASAFLSKTGYQNAYLSSGIVFGEQVFGSRVHVCLAGDSGRVIKNVDGLISSNPGQVLVVTTADCVPMMLYDPVKKVVGNLHGARLCLAQGIVANAINKMVRRFSVDPGSLIVGMGPHIRSCHYWLRDKTLQGLQGGIFTKYFIQKGDKTYFDLTKLAVDKLLEAGVARGNIYDCGICTFCKYKKYFSQRKHEENSRAYAESMPRFASLIGLRSYWNILKINRQQDSLAAHSAVIKYIKEGKVVVLPTDTVYGLVCDATNDNAVNRLLKIKNRAKGKPLPIFVKDINMAKKFARISAKQEDFLRSCWPGKMTAVLQNRSKLPKSLLGENNTVGLRVPEYPFLNQLLRRINHPLTGTSANVSGMPAAWNVQDVINQFELKHYKPDLIVDAGRLLRKKPSKVVDLTSFPYKILRP